MKRKYVLYTLFSLLIYPILHELGHLFMAKILGGKILRFNYLYVNLMPESIISTNGLILFKLGGLIFTFYPSLVLFFYLWKKQSELIFIPEIFLILSPLTSINDFNQILNLIQITYIRTYLNIIFNVIQLISTSSLIIFGLHFTSMYKHVFE